MRHRRRRHDASTRRRGGTTGTGTDTDGDDTESDAMTGKHAEISPPATMEIGAGRRATTGAVTGEAEAVAPHRSPAAAASSSSAAVSVDSPTAMGMSMCRRATTRPLPLSIFLLLLRVGPGAAAAAIDVVGGSERPDGRRRRRRRGIPGLVTPSPPPGMVGPRCATSSWRPPGTTSCHRRRWRSSAPLALAVPRGGVRRGGGGGGAADTTASTATATAAGEDGDEVAVEGDEDEEENDDEEGRARLDAMVEDLIGDVSSSSASEDDAEDVKKDVDEEGATEAAAVGGGSFPPPGEEEEEGGDPEVEGGGATTGAATNAGGDDDDVAAVPSGSRGAVLPDEDADVGVGTGGGAVTSMKEEAEEKAEAAGAVPSVVDVGTQVAAGTAMKRRGTTTGKKQKQKKMKEKGPGATISTATALARKKDNMKKGKKASQPPRDAEAQADDEEESGSLDDPKRGEVTITPTTSARKKDKTQKKKKAPPRHDAEAEAEAEAEKEASVDDSEPGEAPPSAEVATKSGEAPEAPVRQLPPIPPPPPNALYRFLLRRLHGFGGHVVVLTLVLLTELCRTYVPPLYGIVLGLLVRSRMVEDPVARRLRLEAEYREGERRRGRRGGPSQGEETHEQYGAFVSSDRGDAKTRRARTKTLDKVAARKLRTLSRRMATGIGEVKYRHLSLDFMRRHGLGAFAGTRDAAAVAAEAEDGPPPLAADVGADVVDNERLISKSLTAAAKITDEAVEEEAEEGLDDSDDGDWVVRALATGAAGDGGDGAGTGDDGREGYLDVVSESVTLVEREEVVEFRPPPPPPSPSFSLGFNFNIGSSTSRRRRSRGRRSSSSSKSAVLAAAEEAAASTAGGRTRKGSATSGPRTSDRDGGGGVMGRIRAVGTSSAISNRILGAYPGDAPPVEEAGSPVGLAGLAADRYGYGEWSSYDDDEGGELIDGDDSGGGEEDDEVGGGSRRPRKVKRVAKKRKKRRRRRGEEEAEPLDEGPSHILSSGFEGHLTGNGLGLDMAASDLNRPVSPTPKSPFGSTASSSTRERRRKGATTATSGETRGEPSIGRAMDVESKLEGTRSTARSPFGVTSRRSSIDRTGTTKSPPVKLPMQRLQEAAAKRDPRKRDGD